MTFRSTKADSNRNGRRLPRPFSELLTTFFVVLFSVALFAAGPSQGAVIQSNESSGSASAGSVVTARADVSEDDEDDEPSAAQETASSEQASLGQPFLSVSLSPAVSVHGRSLQLSAGEVSSAAMPLKSMSLRSAMLGGLHLGGPQDRANRSGSLASMGRLSLPPIAPDKTILRRTSLLSLDETGQLTTTSDARGAQKPPRVVGTATEDMLPPEGRPGRDGVIVMSLGF